MKAALLVSLLAAVLGLGAYVGSPYYTLHQLKQAARSSDGEQVLRFIDVPSVKEDLRGQVAVFIRGKIADSGFLADMTRTVANAAANAALDAAMTPQGITQGLAGGRWNLPEGIRTPSAAPTPSALGPAGTARGAESVQRTERRYVGLNLFVVSVYDASPTPMAIVEMSRRDFFFWRVTRLTLPVLTEGGQVAKAPAPPATSAAPATPTPGDVVITEECAWPYKVTEPNAKIVCNMFYSRTPEERATLLRERAVANAPPASLPPVSFEVFAKSSNPADRALAAELIKLEYMDLCAAYGKAYRTDPMGKRLQAIESLDRGSTVQFNFSDDDKAQIAQERVSQGMPMCQVYAALGHPARAVRSSEAGVDRVYIYDNGLLVAITAQSRVYGVRKK